MIGKALGHYQITGLLGKGGMGEVYRARDTRLERDIALKVLPADLAADPARLERFQREARAIAALNHPHIVTLHTVEEDHGVHFLTMELIEGQGLDLAIGPGGFPLTKVFDIGIAVADALAAAHEKGIVHRDLKPANVMLARDGRVKVLDFGLAKLAASDVQEQSATQVSPITAEGTAMGTVPYMSPEQLRTQSVDHRSDIFSFGVLLYELTTGRRPFTGPTNADVTSSILTRTPPPVTQAKPDLPQHLGRIVSQCLEKEPEDRYQSAKDIRNELRTLRKEVDSGVSVITEIRPTTSGHAAATTGSGRSSTRMWIGIVAAVAVVAIAGFVAMNRKQSAVPGGSGTSTADQERTIAVLPFANMSGDESQEFFSDGISEELLNLLSKVQELRVAARTSSFSFKGKDVGIPEIAKQLNVAYVLEGSVRKADDQVRVTAQLIHASDGYHVWSETYDRQLDDIFAIQDDIAADVVKQLQIKLLGHAPETHKTNADAYAMYLQAVQLGRLGTSESYKSGEGLLRRVLAIDSTYAPAFAQMGALVINQVNLDLLPLDVGVARSRAAFDRAIELDPQYGLAYSGRGYLAMAYENDMAGAARLMEHAVALDPGNTRVLGNAATLLSYLGRQDEAISLSKASIRRDPVNVTTQFNLGLRYLWARRYDESIATLRAALTLSPQRAGAHHMLATALLYNGDAPAALAEIEQETNEPRRKVGQAVVYHALGRKADSDAALADLVAMGETQTYFVAMVHAFRGDDDLAFEWLARESALAGSAAEVPMEPMFAGLHDDPRWLPLLRKHGVAPEQLSKIPFKIELPDEV